MQTAAWALYVHLPGYLQGLGASEWEIGVLIGASAIAAIAVRPWAGSLMDRRGRRPVLLGGAAMAAVASLTYLTIPVLGSWLLTIRIFHGLAEGVLFAVVYVYATDVIPAGLRTEGLAIFGIAGLLPFGIASVLGDWLLVQFSFQELFLTATVFSLIALVTVCFLPELKLPAAEGQSSPRPRMTAAIKRNLLPLWWLVFVYAVTIASVSTFLKTYVAVIGYGSVGGYFMSLALAATAVRFAFLRLPSVLRDVRMIMPAFVLCAVALVVLALAQVGSSFLVAGLLAGVADGFIFTLMLALAVSRSATESRGVVVAVYVAAFDAGILVGSPVLGLVITWLGYTSMYPMTAALAIIGVVTFWVWDIWAARGGSNSPVPSLRSI